METNNKDGGEGFDIAKFKPTGKIRSPWDNPIPNSPNLFFEYKWRVRGCKPHSIIEEAKNGIPEDDWTGLLERRTVSATDPDVMVSQKYHSQYALPLDPFSPGSILFPVENIYTSRLRALSIRQLEMIPGDKIFDCLEHHLFVYTYIRKHPKENFIRHIKFGLLQEIKEGFRQDAIREWLGKQQTEGIATNTPARPAFTDTKAKVNTTSGPRKTRPATLSSDERRKKLVENYMQVERMNRTEAIKAAAEKDGCGVDTIERALGLRKRR